MSGITERSLNTLELPAIRTLLAERSSYVPGRELAEHDSPGEATVQVLHGRVKSVELRRRP